MYSDFNLIENCTSVPSLEQLHIVLSGRPESKTVHLTELHPSRHEELFEHHPVLATLPSRHTNSTGPQALPIILSVQSGGSEAASPEK